MKKIIAFIFLLAFIQVNAQVVLKESFDDTFLPNLNPEYPSGWAPSTKIAGYSNSLWKIKTSFFVKPNPVLPVERKYLVGFDTLTLPSRAFNEWLTSKEVTLLNNSRTNIVSFYSFHVSDGTHFLKISDNGGTTWTNIWVDNDTKNTYSDRCMDSSTIDVAIPDSYKGKTVKFAWVFESPTCTSAWAFDNITVEAVISGVDIMPKQITSPFEHQDTINSIIINTDIPVSVLIVNNGRSDATNVPVSYVLNGGTPVNEVIPLIKAKENLLFTFAQKMNIPNQGINSLVINTNATGDELTDNNNTEAINFWTVDTSKKVVFDFDDPSLMDEIIWRDSKYKKFKQDNGTMPEGFGYESLFGEFIWKVGTASVELYTPVWGIFCVYTYSKFNEGTSIAADRWLILPKCRINNSTEPVFLQWNAASTNQSGVDVNQYESYEVLVSEDSNLVDDFTKIHEVLNEKLILLNEPVKPYNRSTDLSAYKGKDVYIAFRVTTNSTESRGLCVLDNITIFGNAMLVPDKINEIEMDKTIKLYPNPVNDKINIESKYTIQKVEIFNLMGQKINEIEPNNLNCFLNVSTYENGLYIIKVKTSEGDITRKVNIIK